MNESVLLRRHKEPISQRPCPPLFKGWARALRAGRGQPKAVYKTCGEAAPQLSGLKGPSNLRTLRTFGARGPVPLWCLRQHLPLASGGTIKVGNPSSQPTASAVPLFYNLRRQPPPQPSGPKAPSNLRTLRTLGTKSRQPSRRRRVH